jgi:hypothetical protein
MSSTKFKVIRPNSKLGKIICNARETDEYSNTSGDGCEYVYGDPQEDFHYCGRPIARRRYCEEHHALCYTVKARLR